MTSQTGEKTITVPILPNISRTKDNQTMIFGQLTGCNERNIFLQKSCRKSDRETSSRFFLLLEKDLYEEKASGTHHSFNIFR